SFRGETVTLPWLLTSKYLMPQRRTLYAFSESRFPQGVSDGDIDLASIARRGAAVNWRRKFSGRLPARFGCDAAEASPALGQRATPISLGSYSMRMTSPSDRPPKTFPAAKVTRPVPL